MSSSFIFRRHRYSVVITQPHFCLSRMALSFRSAWLRAYAVRYCMELLLMSPWTLSHQWAEETADFRQELLSFIFAMLVLFVGMPEALTIFAKGGLYFISTQLNRSLPCGRDLRASNITMVSHLVVIKYLNTSLDTIELRVWCSLLRYWRTVIRLLRRLQRWCRWRPPRAQGEASSKPQRLHRLFSIAASSVLYYIL